MLPFNPAPMTSYERSIVITGLSRIVSEINGDIRGKSPIFPTPCIERPRWRGSSWNWVSTQESQETRMMGLSDDKVLL